MWFPVPSFEVGAGAVHLVDSHIWTGQLYAKLALHEGYHDLPLPSLAVRGAVSRMMNQRELDLTVASLDVDRSPSTSASAARGASIRTSAGTCCSSSRAPRSSIRRRTSTRSQPGNEHRLAAQLRVQGSGQHHPPAVLRRREVAVLRLPAHARGAVRARRQLGRRSRRHERRRACRCRPRRDCDAKDTAKAQRTLSMSAGFDF